MRDDTGSESQQFGERGMKCKNIMWDEKEKKKRAVVVVRAMVLLYQCAYGREASMERGTRHIFVITTLIKCSY